MKNIRLIAALALAFGSLAFAQPSLASDWQTSNGRVVDGTVQFDYRGGQATQTLTVPDNSVLTIAVNNTTANCIGTCTPRPDTWSLTINGERWEGNTIDIVTIQTTVSGDVTIVATGRDEGFWGGWYGPVFSAPVISSPEPAPVETGTWEGQVFTATAPEGQVFTAVTGWYGAPNDPSCGADVSAVLATFLGSNTFTVGADNGVFGDPCGGVVKVLRVNLTSTAGPSQIEPSPAPTPSPVETPATSSDTPPDLPAPVESPESQPQPSPTPSVDVVDPVVTPPVIEPQPQPQPIPFPVVPEPQPEPLPELPLPEETQSPETPVEQTPEPTLPEVPESLPEPEATQEPVLPVEEKPLPELPIEPPVIETVEEHSTTVIDEIAELEPSDLTNAQVAELVAVADAIFAVAEQGSPAYEKALEALAIVAEADDAELPAELAAIPLLGDAAGAVLEVFNNIGNVGADMSPAQREKAEETVVAAVVVGQVAQMATATAASAGVSAAASTRKIK